MLKKFLPLVVGRIKRYVQVAYQNKLEFLWFVLVDSVIIFLAFVSALSIRLQTVTTTSYLPYVLFIAVTAVLMIGSMLSFGVYAQMWRGTSGQSVNRILMACALVLIPLGILNFVEPKRLLPMSVFLVGGVLATGGLIAFRYRTRFVPAHIGVDSSLKNLLVVGAGHAGQHFALVLHNNHKMQSEYHLVGYIDDDPQKQLRDIQGVPIMGTRDDIPYLVHNHNIDTVVIAIPSISGPEMREILRICESTTARIKMIPSSIGVLTDKRVAMLRNVRPDDLIGKVNLEKHEDVDLSPVIGKVALVTGAAGSIGSEVCRMLMMYSPIKLLLLDNNESGLHDVQIELQTQYPNQAIQPILCDVTNETEMRRVFAEYSPQIVFHVAAYKHVPMLQYYPNQSLKVNIGGTFLMSRLAAEYQVKRFVLVSTDKAVAPSNVMGASKRVCELIIHAQANRHTDIYYTIVRFGNVIGSRGSVVPLFTKQIDAGGPVTITHPQMKRYFMSISMAANLIIHSACMTTNDDVFILDMGDEIPILKLAEQLIRIRGLRPYQDIELKITGMRPGEKLTEALWYKTENPQPTIHPNITRAKNWRSAYEAEELITMVKELQATGLPQDPDEALEILLDFNKTIDPPVVSLVPTDNPDQAVQ